MLALVVLPVLDRYVFDHSIAAYSSRSPDSGRVPVPNSENSCPICQFVHQAIPFFEVSDPLVWQVDIVAEAYVAISIPSVLYITALPPSRAPPVCS